MVGRRLMRAELNPRGKRDLIGMKILAVVGS